MRFAIALWLMLVAAAFGRDAGLERLFISGSEYVRLSEWAADKGLDVRWDRKNGEIDLVGDNTSLHLMIDSRRAEIGSVAVWLSLPVVNRMGTALISTIDLHTTLEPLLFPRKTESRLTTVCIDPGHGGKDKGEIAGSNYEKKYTLLLAQDVEDLLKEDGFKVILTRQSDQTVELSDRAPVAFRRGADIFVSLHYNSAPETHTRGVEVYCLAPAGVNSSNDGGGRSSRGAETGNEQDAHNVLLAYQVQRSITHSLPVEDRGIKRSNFQVLREARVPAILIEGGYMTNPLDARNIYDSGFRRRMARAIADGLLAYRRVIERD